MYQINDYVVAGSMGICKVNAICVPDFSKDDQLCYVLQPVESQGDVIYVSIDKNKLQMRKIISKLEAEDYIGNLSSIEPVWYDNDKTREAAYKEALKSGNCMQWIQMTKGLYLKKQERNEKGKKLSQTDEKNFRQAERLLMGELALALEIPLEQVMTYIEEQMESQQ